MSLRVLACSILVLFFVFYAWRNWFVSLCAAVLLMALVQHPDMPRNVAGIQGLNPWNLLMLSVLAAWWFQRKRQDLAWDLPRVIGLMLFAYFGIISIGAIRLLLQPTSWGTQNFGFMFSEYFINCFKWVLPGLLFFDACRTPKRVLAALSCILVLYLLLALQ